jgi:hypothetical protein
VSTAKRRTRRWTRFTNAEWSGAVGAVSHHVSPSKYGSALNVRGCGDARNIRAILEMSNWDYRHHGKACETCSSHTCANMLHIIKRMQLR